MDLRDLLSSRTTLTTLVSGDILFTSLARVDSSTITSAVDLAAGSTAVSLFLTETTRFNTELSGLAVLFQWALIGYFIYQFSPTIYPDGFGELTDYRAFRLLTVAASLVYLLTLEEVVSAPILAPIGVTSLLFGGYLVWTQDKSLRTQLETETGQTYDVLSTLIPESEDEADEESLEDSVAAGGWTGTFARVSIVLVVGAVFSIVCAVFGLLGYSIGLFYPLMEVTILGWVAYSHVETRISRVPTVNSTVAEVEDIFYESVAPAFTRVPVKGMATVMLIGLGLAVSGGGFRFAGGVAVSTVTAGTLVFDTWTLADVLTVMLVVGVPVYSVSALLFWFQVTRRVPAYFDYCRVRRDADELTETRQPAVVRPPGYLLPQTGLVAVPLLLGSLPVGFRVNPGMIGGFVIVWCIALGTTVWTVWQTKTSTPQTPASESAAIPVAYALQVPVVFFFNEAEPAVSSLSESYSTTVLDAAYVILVLIIVGVVFFFLEDGMMYMRRDRGFRKYVPVGMVVAVVGVLVPILESTLSLALAGFLIVLAGFWGFTISQ